VLSGATYKKSGTVSRSRRAGGAKSDGTDTHLVSGSPNHLRRRDGGRFEAVAASVLRHTSLIAGLIRALDVPDAERAWLSGDNILSDVMRYPGDVIAGRTTPNRFELLVKMIGISSTAGLRHCIGCADVSHRLPMPVAIPLLSSIMRSSGLKPVDLNGAPLSIS
jgi:hypothetical protein